MQVILPNKVSHLITQPPNTYSDMFSHQTCSPIFQYSLRVFLLAVVTVQGTLGSGASSVKNNLQKKTPRCVDLPTIHNGEQPIKGEN